LARKDEGVLDELFEFLMDLPWWVSVVVGTLCFGIMRFAIPLISSDNSSMDGMIVQTVSDFAWVSVLFVIPMFGSLIRSARKRRLLDRQRGIESIRSLSWKQFEELLGEAYRRQGFTVFENAGTGADGGIDLTIRRDGRTYLVQCKHWKTYKVGVKVIREMLGLVTAHHAAGAIVVTSGVFTREAVSFAANQGVELVDGDALVRLITEVHAQPNTLSSTPPTTPHICPKCGQSLVLRTARKGPNAGSQFWGCAGYPNCRHTEPLAG